MWFLAMSSHVHYGLHDPHGIYPAFMAHFHKMVAKVLNAYWGRFENLWSSEQASVVECVAPQDRFGRMIYSLGNPLAQHLVERAHHWPGVTSLTSQLNGETERIRRPHWFFDKDGDMPEWVELTYGRPPGFEHLSQEEWADKIKKALAVEEEKAAAQRRKTHERVLGVRAIKRQSHLATAATREERRGISPRVAAKDKGSRIAALRRHARFVARYREAFEARRRGDVDVVFPYGTYQLHVLGLVRVEPPPA